MTADRPPKARKKRKRDTRAPPGGAPKSGAPEGGAPEGGDDKNKALWRWVGPAVRRIKLSNYKSIADCDVALAPLTVIVGHNGAGKSNLLDAFAFVAECLRTSVDTAVATRGGIEAVRRRSTGHPRALAIALEVRLPNWQLARYDFSIAEGPAGGTAVIRERVLVRDEEGRLVARLRRDKGTILEAPFAAPPPPQASHLYLPRAAACDGIFRSLHDTLATMMVYRLPTGAGKALLPSDGGALLSANGANLASVIARLAYTEPETLERVAAHLGALVPGVVALEPATVGPYVTVRFRQTMAGARHPWRFVAGEAADGTLRALSVLVAAFQDSERRGALSVAAIEEPAASLHPATVPAIVDALREAARSTQVIATSHRPELIDALDPKRDTLLLATTAGGRCRIEPVSGPSAPGPALPADEADDRAATDREPPPTAGTLLRRGRLSAAREKAVDEKQINLFGTDG
jgi:predicted ATPase